MKFSVLITSFNREKYIAEAIESVLKQSFTDFELIIVDDASSDSTFSIIKNYSEKDSRIRIYQNKNNLGQFRNRNYTASLAQGDYLIFVDSDDTIKPWALTYINNSIDESGSVEYATLYEGIENLDQYVLYTKDIIQKHFFVNSILHIGPGGTVISRTLFNKIGGFSEKYGVASDNYYNILAALHSDTLLLFENYLNYRLHPGQEKNNRLNYLYNGYVYFKDILSHPKMPLEKSEIEFLILKSKRRFLINSCKYLISKWDFKGLRFAYISAGFTLRDIYKAIFQ